MIQNFKIRPKWMAPIVLLSLFLQSCNTSQELPPIEEQAIEGQPRPRKSTRYQQVEDAQSIVDLMPELWQLIFSYLDFEGILAARAVSTGFNELITGTKQVGIVGVENRPSQMLNTDCWIINKEIDFRKAKLSKLTSNAIPSFTFYQLMGEVKNLPKEFWPYLQGTRVHTLNLSSNQIRDAGASQLAQHLLESRVHTLHLGSNQIGAVGAIELAQHLQRSNIHTLDLSRNEIAAAGAIQLAHHLQGSSVHTLDLSLNWIWDATQQLLKEKYPHINWGF